MTDSAGYMLRAANLVEDVMAMHDSLMDKGAANLVITSAEAEHLHSTTADKQWLQGQLHIRDLTSGSRNSSQYFYFLYMPCTCACSCLSMWGGIPLTQLVV